MLLEEFKNKAAGRIRHWAKTEGLEAPADLAFTQPPPHLPADLSVPWPLQAAKLLKRNPLDVAGKLAAHLRDLPEVDAAEASAPGFVNFKFKTEFLCRNLCKILAKPDAYGAAFGVRKRSILIEFVSANPTGPLHLASGRAATLGDSLIRIFKRIGHQALSEYYVNDAGRQVELLGLSVRARYGEQNNQPAQMPEDGYQGDYVKAVAAAAPKEAARWSAQEFSRFAVETMLKLHRRDMEDFRITFDRWFRESELHARGALEQTLATLKQRGMVYEKDKAVWLGTASQSEEDDKDRVLIKSDGRPTYFLADIAYHKDKYGRAEELIDILGADHHGYVPRIRAAMQALGKPPESFHAIIHQLVHLYRGQSLVKMSKRAGEFVTLKELIEEVGVDACRFFFAMRTPNAHMNFDLELAKKQSQENPVYYVQYVHARAASIFREAHKGGLVPPLWPGDDDMERLPLNRPQERVLLAKLLWFPQALSECEKVLSPHPLAGYLTELAGLFHPFYEKCRVVDPANPPITLARLALCGGVKAAIAEGLDLLGVSAPHSM